jgi:aspartyl-tRNA(Asn)/glutamyl-tRNA(Gln) amidotransferase subunit C
MNIDHDVILKLEKLAKLRLTDEERMRFSTDLTKIIGMIDQLQSLDTTGVEPLRYLTEWPAEPRADEVKNQLSREKALENAPNTDGEFFRVPKMKF